MHNSPVKKNNCMQKEHLVAFFELFFSDIITMIRTILLCTFHKNETRN